MFLPHVNGTFSTVKLVQYLFQDESKLDFTRHSNEEKNKIRIMELGGSWRDGCDASHAFYCFPCLLFQSPVTKALWAMKQKVIETMQFNLSRSSGFKHNGVDDVVIQWISLFK